MLETYGYIYKTTNLINGKFYIGQHKSKFFDTKYFGSGKILKQAIKKYGKENFQCFPLAWAWNKAELNQLEIDYIVHYKPEYNLAKGGEGGNAGNKGHTHSEETRKKISESNKRRIISEETRKKISESRKGEKHHYFGKHLTEEHKIKISKSEKGKIMTEEAKKKISEKLKGIKQSEEHIRKRIESKLKTISKDKVNNIGEKNVCIKIT
jgi:group I intron endonuclease